MREELQVNASPQAALVARHLKVALSGAAAGYGRLRPKNTPGLGLLWDDQGSIDGKWQTFGAKCFLSARTLLSSIEGCEHMSARHIGGVALAKLYDRKTPLTAADLLNDRVVPFFDAHEVKLSRVLTDRGTEYCGNPERHEYELYLALEDVDHSRTKTKSPQTNGIVERFHKTVLDEFYRVAFRKRIYGSIAELQADLDEWIRSYNEDRPHQGRWCFGKTPMQTFLDAIPLAKEKMIAA